MVRSNEVVMFRSSNLIDTVVNFFTDLIDHDFTTNCLEIITNLAKHIFLVDLP